MKSLNKFALCVLLMPAVTFSVGAVAAEDEGRQDRNGIDERSDRMTGDDERSDRMSRDKDRQDHRAGTGQDAEYISVTPENAVRVDEVIGSSLRMRDGDDEVGDINDLLIDENGQVVAVIVDVGGFLGIGQRTVAVAWDSVERTRDDDGDSYRFTLDATEDTLRDAPSFDEDRRGVRNDR